MKINICILISICIHTIMQAQTDVYSTKIETHAGAIRDMADFRGRNLLVVCIDPAGRPADQVVEYRQLSRQFKDSGLVVLIFPAPGDSLSGEAGGKETAFSLQQQYRTEDFIVCAIPGKKNR